MANKGIKIYITSEKREDIEGVYKKLTKKKQMKLASLMGIKFNDISDKKGLIYEIKVSKPYYFAIGKLADEFENMIKKVDSDAKIVKIPI